MAALLGKKAAKSVLAKHIAAIEPLDPLYETTIDSKGKSKRRKDPEGLSKRDLRILQKVKKRAHRLDKGMNLCGLRVGWTFWIGIIPGAGDVVDAILNYTLVVRPAKKAEIPDWLVRKMLANNGVSAAVGLIPLVGDVLLGVWKANSRNAHLLEEYLSIRGAEYLASIGYPVDSASPGHDLGVTQDPAVRSEYKPGAGLAPGEVIMPHSAQKQNVTGRGWFNLGGGNARQQTAAAAAAAAGGNAGAAPTYGATESVAQRV
ncbi:hypothetical protein NliqN6_4040 [Naganishia liquefaciens]|uniref:DUF4112 domain-containing protein n=1 Tax=Naganishia liquefaciens TaxID=104408 RepID=A0A8H3YFU5_9TREE|nr:hypothetical protein NliqN6_4040 [Naganishia liquefaciens]